MAGRGGSQSERRRERTPDRGRGSASHPPDRESPSPPPLPLKRHTYRRMASDEEEEIVVVSENSRSPSPQEQPPPSPPKKKPRKTKHVPLQDVSQDSENEREAEEELAAVGFSYPPVRITEKDGKRSFETLNDNDPLVKAASAKMAVMNPLSLPIVSAWEKGMEIMNMLMERYRVESDLKSNFQLMPEQGEVYRRICHLYINEEHRGIPLTFTSNKTLTTMMGRFLQGFVHAHSQIAHKNWESTGCALWLHGCTEVEGKLRCLHGTAMIHKEHMIEMDVASENGQRALKENPDRAKITQNRWGRSVVQLANNDARCCVHDAGCATNQFSSKSCGVFFTEGAKAQQAFKQLEAFMKAMYPGMNAAQAQMMLIPLHCDCNHKPGCVPTMGRQTCKMTPFGMANAEDLDVDGITDATVLASVKHPALMVFQCCNPVYRNSRAQNAGPNCDFKISAPDLLGALQLTRKLWTDSFPDTLLPKLLIPEFKWLAKYQFRNVSLPAGHAETSRQNPFDF
ncbi:single-stranded DNA-binding protein [Human adenovirus 4]|uniref:DNA-binding protein n=1 Tax=Human adenovirus E serotype 4 TaxID=28280 RepID=A0A1W2KFE2_ADE04|nr:single-stranded DNA-binding protein [Human adenovirus E4]ANQ44346.1 single-stranded DNA-binding protein [Human adenovirus E4]